MVLRQLRETGTLCALISTAWDRAMQRRIREWRALAGPERGGQGEGRTGIFFSPIAGPTHLFPAHRQVPPDRMSRMA